MIWRTSKNYDIGTYKVYRWEASDKARNFYSLVQAKQFVDETGMGYPNSVCGSKPKNIDVQSVATPQKNVQATPQRHVGNHSATWKRSEERAY